MNKKQVIKKIRGAIAEWGAFTLAEMEGFEAPVFNHYGNAHYMLIEGFNMDNVLVTTYINEIALGSDYYSYDELSDSALKDVLAIAESYDEMMWRVNEASGDYDQ